MPTTTKRAPFYEVSLMYLPSVYKRSMGKRPNVMRLQLNLELLQTLPCIMSETPALPAPHEVLSPGAPNPSTACAEASGGLLTACHPSQLATHGMKHCVESDASCFHSAGRVTAGIRGKGGGAAPRSARRRQTR